MQELARLPEESLLSLCRKLAALSGGRVAENEAYETAASETGFFYSRYALRAAASADVIDRLLADAAQNGGPGLVGFTHELAGAEWNAALEARGFSRLAEQAGMLLALESYIPREADASIRRIGREQLKEWSRVCEVSFPKPSEMPALRCWIGEPDCEFYAYMEEGRIIGTLLGYAAGGNYGIHEVATLPERRGRGVCTALLHHALASARRAGNRFASLQASPAGAAVYERCGMRRVSTLSTWILPQG
ncbi:MAG: GNAT family N-acetyltransferase [Clostridia bacterium]|nr:GNAT family N-acetyltransferase [Clostridia bacterium]